jgi:HAD superfamily hydrolase (TIGR01549 family)
MIRATTPLIPLFSALRAAGIQIAVVTSDDRAPTLAALEWLKVIDHVVFIACADDGYPYKPAPEAVWAACKSTGIPAQRAAMVGDSTTDMLMAQRAGVGLRVAVLTGLMDRAVLAPLADVVLDSIGEIHT